MYHSKAVSSLSELDIKYATDSEKVSTMRKNGVLKLKSKIRVSDGKKETMCWLLESLERKDGKGHKHWIDKDTH